MKFDLKEYTCFPVKKRMPPPDGKGWERLWLGYYVRSESLVDATRKDFQTMFSREVYPAYVLEVFSFLSILDEIGGDDVTLFELGAGRAPWCLALAAASRFRLVSQPPRTSRMVAVEAEPIHFRWSTEHCLRQGLNAQVLWGAVSDTVGTRRFWNDVDPAASMGQALTPGGNIEVPSYSVDYLRGAQDVDRIDVMHMDVQGAELEVIKGCRESLMDDAIEYIIIGTHSKILEEQLKSSLENTHDLLVDLTLKGELRWPGIRKVFRSSDDGVQVWRRKGAKRR